MRITVLTGVFACAVIFVAGTAKADAATLQPTETITTSSTIERMVAVAETTKSPLLEIAEEPEVKTEEVKPVEPIKHIVGDNESLSKIAETHDTTWQRIFDKNESLENPNIISQGTELVIPEAEEVLEKREFVEPDPVVVQPRVRSASSTAVTASAPAVSAPRRASSGNGYVAGYCTWYVKNRRPDLPNNLGNARTWVSRAASQGLATGSTPRAGAVGQQGNHVVYIESVNGDGTVTVSDMNWSGLYVKTVRTVSSSNFRYIY